MNLLRQHSFALHHTHVATAICIATHRVLRMHYAIAISVAGFCMLRMCQLLHRHTMRFPAPLPLAHIVTSPPLQVPPDGAADVTYMNLPTVCPVTVSRGNSAHLHTIIVPYCNFSAIIFALSRLILTRHAILLYALIRHLHSADCGSQSATPCYNPAAPVSSTSEQRQGVPPCNSQNGCLSPSSGDPSSMHQPTGTPHTPHARTHTYDTLTFGSLNVGGVEVTPNRLCHILSGFKPLPHTLSLQEFRPSSTSSLRDHERVAMYWGYHLLASSPSSKEGVALLIHTSIAPAPPAIRVHIPGRLISASISLHSDPSMPSLSIASFYGPHTAAARLPCEKALTGLSQERAIILGDYNAVTHPSHTTALRAPMWPWLVAKERASTLVDLITPHRDSVPFTRVRRYGGTKSYIDRAYGSRLFQALFQTSGAQVPDFSGVTVIQDHDPILIHTSPWSQQVLPEMRCAMWNRRDVTSYKKCIAVLTADMPPPVSAHDCALTYAQLTSHMLTAMREVNASKAPVTPASDDPSDWASVSRQLAKEAKRRSKVFYRRVKHTLLSPPAQSTLPTPTGKIQRILQRNTPWSAHALSHIPHRPRPQTIDSALSTQSRGARGWPRCMIYLALTKG